MDRKTFLKKSLGLVVVAASANALINCTTTDEEFQNAQNNNNNNVDCSANGASASEITGNHGHTLAVSSEDINSGVDKTYSIQGTSGHTHEITVTAADFANLAADNPVQFITTQSSGHTHTVTVSCQ